MQTTISPPTRDTAPTEATAPRVPLPGPLNPVRSGFDRERARQRFTAIAAIAALLLSVVSVVRSTETGVLADPAPRADPIVPTPVELTSVETPPNGLYGNVDLRGGGPLAGLSEYEGVDVLGGTFWVREPGGYLRGDAVAHGRLLYVSSPTYDTVYRIDLTTGGVIKELPAKGRVVVSAAVGRLAKARGDGIVLTTLYVDEDGTVYGVAAEGTASWSEALGEPVAAAPVIADGHGVVVTEAGRVYGFNADGPAWVFPRDGAVEPISVSPAFQDGIWYVADNGGVVHLLDVTGVQVCPRPVGLPPIGNLVVENGTVFLQSLGYLATFPAGACEGGMRMTQSATDTSQPIAVHDGVVFSVDGHLLFPFEPDAITMDGLRSNGPLGAWDAPFYAGSDITTPPVVAAGLVYIGTRDGLVLAVNESSGQEEWRFDANVATGSDVAIQDGIVVLDGAVIVTTSGGHVIAIAGVPPIEAPVDSTRSSMG